MLNIYCKYLNFISNSEKGFDFAFKLNDAYSTDILDETYFHIVL